MRNLFKNSAIFLGSLGVILVLGLGILEVYLRAATEVDLTPGLTRTDDVRPYEFKPGAVGRTYDAVVRINTYGIRDSEDPPDPDAFRIALFGDSIAFGIGVPAERMLSEVLEDRLAATLSNDVQVFNFGIPSYNMLDEYNYMVESFSTFSPDLILFEMTTINDCSMSKIYDVGVNDVAAVRWVKDVLRNLYAYKFLAARFYAALRNVKAILEDTDKNEYAQRQNEERGTYSEGKEGWEICQATFAKIAQFAEQKDIPVVFGIFSNNVKLAPKIADDPNRHIVETIRSALKRVGIKEIVVLDDAFRDYAGREENLWVRPDDSHWSRLAHRLAAERVHDFLLERGLVPRPGGLAGSDGCTDCPE